MDEKWTQKLNQLDARRQAVAAAGGPERIEKQHASSKLTDKVRMKTPFDGSYR